MDPSISASPSEPQHGTAKTGPNTDHIEQGHHGRDAHQTSKTSETHEIALADADAEIHVTKTTYLAVFFLGFTFQPSLTFTILFCFPAIVPIAVSGLALNNVWQSQLLTRCAGRWNFKAQPIMQTGWHRDGLWQDLSLLRLQAK